MSGPDLPHPEHEQLPPEIDKQFDFVADIAIRHAFKADNYLRRPSVRKPDKRNLATMLGKGILAHVSHVRVGFTNPGDEEFSVLLDPSSSSGRLTIPREPTAEILADLAKSKKIPLPALETAHRGMKDAIIQQSMALNRSLSLVDDTVEGRGASDRIEQSIYLRLGELLLAEVAKAKKAGQPNG